MAVTYVAYCIILYEGKKDIRRQHINTACCHVIYTISLVTHIRFKYGMLCNYFIEK